MRIPTRHTKAAAAVACALCLAISGGVAAAKPVPVDPPTSTTPGTATTDGDGSTGSTGSSNRSRGVQSQGSGDLAPEVAQAAQTKIDGAMAYSSLGGVQNSTAELRDTFALRDRHKNWVLGLQQGALDDKWTESQAVMAIAVYLARQDTDTKQYLTRQKTVRPYVLGKDMVYRAVDTTPYFGERRPQDPKHTAPDGWGEQKGAEPRPGELSAWYDVLSLTTPEVGTRDLNDALAFEYNTNGGRDAKADDFVPPAALKDATGALGISEYTLAFLISDKDVLTPAEARDARMKNFKGVPVAPYLRQAVTIYITGGQYTTYEALAEATRMPEAKQSGNVRVPRIPDANVPPEPYKRADN